MSEPLTDQDLIDLKACGFSIQRGPTPRYLGVLAEAEIRELRERLKANSCRLSALEAGLEKHGRHREKCPALRFGEFEKCECGLDAALNGKDAR